MIVRGGGRPDRYPIDGPSVTTVLKQWGNAEPLISWAVNLQSRGLNYRTERDRAALIGSVAHDMIEDAIHGDRRVDESRFDPGVIDTAREIRNTFIDWLEGISLEITHTEMPLVSERYAFAGTLDAIGLMRGRLVLPDWKTSNSIYASYVMQLGAYSQLMIENGLGEPDQAHILRISKRDFSYHHHCFSAQTLARGRDGFLRLREVYDIDRFIASAIG